MYENICNTDLPVFVHKEDIQAIKELAKDFKNRRVFGNKIETNLLRHKDAFQVEGHMRAQLISKFEGFVFQLKQTIDIFLDGILFLRINQSVFIKQGGPKNTKWED